jgi:hypothetical protein
VRDGSALSDDMIQEVVVGICNRSLSVGHQRLPGADVAARGCRSQCLLMAVSQDRAPVSRWVGYQFLRAMRNCSSSSLMMGRTILVMGLYFSLVDRKRLV